MLTRYFTHLKAFCLHVLFLHIVISPPASSLCINEFLTFILSRIAFACFICAGFGRDRVHFHPSNWHSAACLRVGPGCSGAAQTPPIARIHPCPRDAGAGRAARRAAQERGLAARPPAFPSLSREGRSACKPDPPLTRLPGMTLCAVECPFVPAPSQLLLHLLLAEPRSPWLSVSSAQQHLKHQRAINIALTMNPNRSAAPVAKKINSTPAKISLCALYPTQGRKGFTRK